MARVLIADDEWLQRLLIRETLADDSSLSFVEAENGIQALEWARRAQPDVIILDVMMPKMDGLAVYRALRADQTLQAIPVIFTTAFPEKIDEVTRLNLGITKIVKKPFEEAELLASLAQALQGSTT